MTDKAFQSCFNAYDCLTYQANVWLICTRPVWIFPTIVLTLHGSHVRHSSCTTRSVFKRVWLPCVQGKGMIDLYVAGSTEAWTIGCATDLYDRGNEPLLLNHILSDKQIKLVSFSTKTSVVPFLGSPQHLKCERTVVVCAAGYTKIDLFSCIWWLLSLCSWCHAGRPLKRQTLFFLLPFRAIWAGFSQLKVHFHGHTNPSYSLPYRPPYYTSRTNLL
jgi:hypothetical protein